MNDAMFSSQSVICVIVAFILSLVISLVVFFTLVKTRRTPNGRFTRWLKEYLNFRSILIESILKFVYVFLATLLTVYSFGLIPSSFLGFLLVVFFGNIILRLIFEFSIMFIIIWKNTSDISANLNDIRNEGIGFDYYSNKVPMKEVKVVEKVVPQSTQKSVSERPVIQKQTNTSSTQNSHSASLNTESHNSSSSIGRVPNTLQSKSTISSETSEDDNSITL